MKYKIIVDKQSRVNPSDEKRTYEIDIEELRRKGNIADSFVFTREEAYVMRRLSLSEYHVLSVLPEPVKEPLEIENIELFKGDNYIYIIDMTGNKFYAEYILDNDFNKTFATKVEMFATIETLADSINLEVSKKVGNDEIISKINMSPEEILINGNKINIDGKAVHFKTNVSNTIGPFTMVDKEKIQNYIMGTGTLTSEDFQKYDINKDGEVDTHDLAIVTRAISNGGYYTSSGTYEINPYSDNKNIVLQSDNGTYQSIISLLYNYFNSLQVGGLETTPNNEKVSSYIGGTISMQQANSPNSIFMQIGNDWYGDKSSSGISLMNGNSGQIGSIDIITQKNDSFISLSANGTETKVKASGITTPVLTQTSREETKKNFEKFENGLDILKQVDIYRYNLKNEEDDCKKHIGFVIGDNYKYSHEITAENNKGKEIGVDIYSMVSVLWKAVQEQQEQIEKMQKEINQLKEVQNGKD